MMRTFSGTVPVVTQQLAGHLQEGAAADVVVAPRAVMEQLLAQRLVRRDSLIDVLCLIEDRSQPRVARW